MTANPMQTSPLHALAPELWCYEHTLSLSRAVLFPARTTVVRLPGGELLLYSPLPIDDAIATALGQLGSVTQFVAPNRFHHMYVQDALTRYPKARLWISPGLAAKRPELQPHATLAEPPPPEWQGQLVPFHIQGMPQADEYAFLHVPSRSLLVADFVFNLREPLPVRTRWLLRMVSAHDKLAQSRMLGMMAKDRAALRESARELLALDFDRLIPAHGQIVERSARGALARALAEHELYRDL
jgi:hypothetical protein